MLANLSYQDPIGLSAGSGILLSLNSSTYTTTATFAINAANTLTLDAAKLILDTSSTAFASLNFPVGVAPTTPVTGDLWSTAAGLFYYNGTSNVNLTTGGGGMTNPMSAVGDVIIGGTAGAATRLPATTNGWVLTLVSGSPYWAAPSAGTFTSGQDPLISTQMISATNNSTFASAGNWAYGTGWSFTTGTITHVTGNATAATLAQAYLSAATVVNNWYTITLDIVCTTQGVLTVGLGGVISVSLIPVGTITAYCVTIQPADTTTALSILADATFAGTIDNVIVQRNTFGYSAIQGNRSDSTQTAYIYAPLSATNTFLGYQAGFLSLASAINNSAFGYSALRANSTGTRNMAIGIWSLGSNTTGSSNIGIGVSALLSNTVGSNNIGIGDTSLTTNTVGSCNTGIGSNTLIYLSTGWYNTAIGYESGDALTTGSGNVFIGNGSGGYQTTINYSLLIDNRDRGNAANEIANSLIYGLSNSTASNNTLQLGGTGVVTINGVQVSSSTGTGALIVLGGVGIAGGCFAAQFNKITITAPATNATLTLIQGSTLTTGTAASLTLSLSSAVSTIATIPSGTHTLAGLDVVQSFTAVQTFSILPVMTQGISLSAYAGGTTNGQLWYDSTQLGLATYVNGLKTFVQGVVFSNRTSTSVTLAAIATYYSAITTQTLIGTNTLPANFFVSGKSIKLKVMGLLTVVTTASIINFRVSIGSTTINCTATASLPAGSYNVEIEANIVSLAPGSSGTFSGMVVTTYQVVGTTTANVVSQSTIGTANTTGTLAVDCLINAASGTTSTWLTKFAVLEQNG